VNYWVRRLLLLPLTLLAIAVVNFAVINLAPGDPTTTTDIGEGGDAMRRAQGALGHADPYFQFREEFGLNLPIMINLWPWISQEKVQKGVQALAEDPDGTFKLRRELGDQARYVMASLMAVAKAGDSKVRLEAMRLLGRGARRVGLTGSSLTADQRANNEQIARHNHKVEELVGANDLVGLEQYLESNGWFRPAKLKTALVDTRIYRYFSKIARLDFGTLRTDPSRRVVDEVAARLKYSLTLAVLPLVLSFSLSLCLGVVMAFHHGRALDWSLGLTTLVLYAIPTFIMAPMLLDLVPLHAPTGELVSGGLTSSPEQYEQLTAWHRLGDISIHCALPLISLVYLPLAVQTRLCRTSMLEVLHQDYIRAAQAKGLSAWSLCWSHVMPNGAIALLTAVGGALGTLLGGSLIVETVFNLDGFGQFFLRAIVQRDYNVILFSVLASSGLALTGYLLADMACTRLDPRSRLAEGQI
jgi:peptide/nickel transport system permease protein